MDQKAYEIAENSAADQSVFGKRSQTGFGYQ